MSRKREAFWFYLFISPWLIGFLAFMAYPLIMSFYYSFTSYNVVNPPEFVGLRNYINLFNDRLFRLSVRATTIYTLAAIPLGLLLSLFFAVLLNRPIPGRTLFRAFLYFPSMISGVGLSILWLWIFNPQIGVLNYLLNLFGISSQLWLLEPRLAIPSLVIMSLWGLGATTIIFLAALQGVPTTLYEVAMLDGCSPFRRMVNITLPLISPVFLFLLITGIIGGFQVFTQAYVMTNGGPNYATFFYVFYLFRRGFSDWDIGVATAMAWLLMVAIIFITILIFKFSKRFVYSEERS